jgi:membrane protein YqaA with SNARE-associated domain
MPELLNNGFKNALIWVAVFLFMVAVFLFLSNNPDFLDLIIKDFGLVGLLAGAIIANATIFLPLPLDAVVLFIGAEPEIIGLSSGIISIIIIALVAGFGATIGEMTAYIIGLMGIKTVEKAKHTEFRRLKEARKSLRKSGMVFVFVASLTPFPFDLVGIAAGLIKFDVKKFFVSALAGKIVRYFLIAFAGSAGIGIIKIVFGLP